MTLARDTTSEGLISSVKGSRRICSVLFLRGTLLIICTYDHMTDAESIGFLPARSASMQQQEEQQTRRRNLDAQAFKARNQQGANHVIDFIGYRRLFSSAFRYGEDSLQASTAGNRLNPHWRGTSEDEMKYP